MSESPDLLNFLYRLSRLRIRRLISWVIHGKDDLPRMSFAGSCNSSCLNYILQKTQTNRIENEHVENIVFDVVAALRPCFSYGSLAVLFTTPHNTVRLPHEIQKIVVADRCKADAKRA